MSRTRSRGAEWPPRRPQANALNVDLGGARGDVRGHGREPALRGHHGLANRDIRAQRRFDREAVLLLDVPLDERLALPCRLPANGLRDVLVAAPVELGGAIVHIEGVQTGVTMEGEDAGLAAARRPGDHEHQGRRHPLQRGGVHRGRGLHVVGKVLRRGLAVLVQHAQGTELRRLGGEAFLGRLDTLLLPFERPLNVGRIRHRHDLMVPPAANRATSDPGAENHLSQEVPMAFFLVLRTMTHQRHMALPSQMPDEPQGELLAVVLDR
jgi:hypothetical protein